MLRPFDRWRKKQQKKHDIPEGPIPPLLGVEVTIFKVDLHWGDDRPNEDMYLVAPDEESVMCLYCGLKESVDIARKDNWLRGIDHDALPLPLVLPYCTDAHFEADQKAARIQRIIHWLLETYHSKRMPRILQ